MVGVGDAGEHVGLAHLPPGGGRDRVGQRTGEIGQPLSGLGEQVQDTDLGEHAGVPVGIGADEPGEPADAVGEGAGAGVDEAGGQIVPRRVAGERRIGETRADAVLEPPVELDETLAHASDPLVARTIAVDRRHRLGSIGRFGIIAGAGPGLGSGAGCRVGRVDRSGWSVSATGFADGPSARPARARIHRATAGGGAASGTTPRTHMTSNARACLHGSLRLGHEQRQATST